MMCRRKRVNVSNVNNINDTINDIFINIVRKMCQIATQNDTQLHLPSLQRIILHCIHAAINDNVDRYMGIRINCKTAFFFHQLFLLLQYGTDIMIYTNLREIYEDIVRKFCNTRYTNTIII